ncbi:DNA-3-methyladenine glycosylase family protein [Rhodohalobacter sp. 614A]|uniref:DNA-3-methyladenine glycosylase family protein n=1 Tax=Rhodohalobacter sp. 614A TaxID=2908649 RepID=UPI001F2EB813|nr:hypothetical protein [Rhodohalobacter sp. 614A]
MNKPEKEIHHFFIETAKELHPNLANAITTVGVQELPVENSEPLAHRLCRSVAQQQLSVKAARTIWGRVLEAANETPLTDFFHDQNVELLHTCGLSKAKTRAICGIAEVSRNGGLEACELKFMDYKSRTDRLTSLWGVGRWTADMISIFYFGDEDIWPDGDLAARKTLEKLTSRRRKTIRTAERFAPYRSYLALYMWKYQDTIPD